MTQVDKTKLMFFERKILRQTYGPMLIPESGEYTRNRTVALYKQAIQ